MNNRDKEKGGLLRRKAVDLSTSQVEQLRLLAAIQNTTSKNLMEKIISDYLLENGKVIDAEKVRMLNKESAHS